MPTRYRRNARDVEAILFDGSAEAAAEICTAFSGVANHEACVAVAMAFGQVFAGAGCWIVRDCRTRALRVVDDREFSAQFEVVDEPSVTLGYAPVAGLPVVRLGGH